MHTEVKLSDEVGGTCGKTEQRSPIYKDGICASEDGMRNTR